MAIGRVFMWISIITVISIIVILILWLIRWWAQGGQFKKKNVRLTGKVAIITGGNTGIGKQTAIDLARRGARIYLACRDKKRAEDARREIIHITLNGNVFFIPCDLACMASVRSFVDEFLRIETRLDILINNAADRFMFLPRTESKDGFEMHLAIYLGHFLLTNLLLDTLKLSAPSRIINVSCKSHRYAQINRFDLNLDKSYNQYQAYFQSKLANILFTRTLAKRLQSTGVTANSTNPGIIRIELGTHRPFIEILLSPLSLFMKTIESGSQTLIALSVDPDLAEVTGKYFVDCKIANESERAKDDETAEWLWEMSEIMTGLREAV